MEEKYNHSDWREQEIDLFGIMLKIWSMRKTIVVASVIGIFLGIVISLTTPNTYRSSVSFVPETQQKMGSGVSSIASIMGVSLDNSIDAISAEMFPDVISSTPFLYDLMSLHVESKDKEISTDLFTYLTKCQKKSWIKVVLSSPFMLLDLIINGKDKEQDYAALDIYNLPPKYRGAIKDLSKSISLNTDKKSGMTTLNVVMQDPCIAATVNQAILAKLKDYMTDYRTAKARRDVENLVEICAERKAEYYAAQEAYAKFADTNKNLVRLISQAEQLKLQQEMQLAYQVYSQVAGQLEAARIKEQQEKPIYVVVEPVTIPNKKYAPSTVKLMALFMILSVISVMCWKFGRSYVSRRLDKNNS